MNLYVALAQVYPERVLAIYIRDVTTPFAPNAHPPAPPPTPRAFSEMPDLPGQFDGAHETPLPTHLSSTPESPTHLFDQDVDPLSPNNPLRQIPDPTNEKAEEKEEVLQAFYARIAAAEKVLPKGVPLRIFRHGMECEKEAVGFVRGAL